MRILFLNWRDLAHPLAGGAEVYTEHVLRRWAQAGHDVTLFAAHVDGKPADEIVDGYRVVRGGGRLTVYREARRWWQANGRHNFDVIIDGTNTVPFQAHKWVDDGTPVVGFFHQTCEEIWYHNAPLPVSVLGKFVLEPRWVRGFADVPTLVVSESTRDAVARFGVKNITVVPEGYEPPAELPTTSKAVNPTLVYAARMVAYKRPFDALEAFALAKKQIPDLQLTMIGGGPLIDKVRATAGPGVSVVGFVPEDVKHRMMAAAHIHIATSVREGWGLVVTEAAALGTPTISYDSPGLRDSTRAAGGVIIEPTPEAMAAAIVDLMPRWIENPSAPLAFGGAASWDVVARDVFAAMATAIGADPVMGDTMPTLLSTHAN